MTVDEAINQLSKEVSGVSLDDCSHHEKAIRLGIQALKRVQYINRYPGDREWLPLPGETEE